MTAHRRVIEDRADEAAANLAEIEGIRADLKLARDRMARLLKHHDVDVLTYEHIEAAYTMLSDELLGKHWFLAEHYAGLTLPDLDATYPGRSAPGSH